MTERWEHGQVITRREVLGYEPTNSIDPNASWFGKSWLNLPVRVVEDTDDALVLYVPPGSPFEFPEHQWPSDDGVHPWLGMAGWQGNGCLMWQQPGEHHAVWHFWSGPERNFTGWYVNLQTAFRRSGSTLDTQDLELDFVVAADGSFEIKDWDAVHTHVGSGRYSSEMADWIHSYGQTLIDRLERNELWWDLSWADWTPPPAWETSAS